MCGIVAYKGNKEKTSKVIFDGLKLLEYRGYDSAGIATLNGDQINEVKCEGRVDALEKFRRYLRGVILSSSLKARVMLV